MTRIYYIIFLMIIAAAKVDAGSWSVDVSQVNGVDSISSDGRIYVTYESRTGAVWTGGTQSTVVTNYLKTKVGKYVVRNEQATFDVEETGTYYYTVHQPYEDRQYKSGKATFSARVYSTAYICDFGRRGSTVLGDGGRTR